MRRLAPLALTLLMACSSHPCSPERIIESENELTAMTSFVIIGQTTAAEVSKELGQPAFAEISGDGELVMYYTWQSIPFTLDEDGIEIGVFTPEMLGAPPGKVNEALILFWYDSSSVVSGMFIQGPKM